jgi:hypothetical protein
MILRFGRYKGKAIKNVPYDYLSWMADNVTMKPRLREAVFHELRVREANTLTAMCPEPPPRADLEGIVRTWYRGLCMAYHPDHGGSVEAMKAINEAHDRLKKLLLGNRNGHH